MTVIASGGKPCLGCESEGGADHPGKPGVPERRRGLCSACYQVARYRGKLDLYPRLDPLAIDRCKVGPQHPAWTPAPWGRVPFDADPPPTPTRWQGMGPVIFPHPAKLNPTAHTRTIEAQTFAAAWLARREQDAA